MASAVIAGRKPIEAAWEASEVRRGSDIQKERAEMLEIYEAPTNLPLPSFARLAGKSRDQLNRDIKARRLLSLSLGNRGQRIPDWQLDPLKHKLVIAVFQQLPQLEPWTIYRMLSEPNEKFKGKVPIDLLLPDNFERTLASLLRDQQ